ncbi:flavin reductase family protein [Streptomyces sp. NPDC005562]|uniref:flavin reductase family protein n=1 Tax=Streptomyces sp. NPDC005562 TaxID=3154890 RepID=UPI0033A7A34F
MDNATIPAAAGTATGHLSVSRGHLSVSPKILYFGTPVALLTTTNPDGTANLAPISSLWALGHTIVLGLGCGGRTGANLVDRPELVINLPSPDLWPAVERLAPLTGAFPVPEAKHGVFRHEPDKFAAAGLHPEDSVVVGPPRVAECPLQLEATVRSVTPVGPRGEFRAVECAVVHVHAAAAVMVPGTQYVDPAAWRPLIYNFRHYYGLAGQELAPGFRSETA